MNPEPAGAAGRRGGALMPPPTAVPLRGRSAALGGPPRPRPRGPARGPRSARRRALPTAPSSLQDARSRRGGSGRRRCLLARRGQRPLAAGRWRRRGRPGLRRGVGCTARARCVAAAAHWTRQRSRNARAAGGGRARLGRIGAAMAQAPSGSAGTLRRGPCPPPTPGAYIGVGQGPPPLPNGRA